MSGGFNFQVNDGVNFTPRQIFSITARALVLSLEKNRPLKVFPGKSLKNKDNYSIFVLLSNKANSVLVSLFFFFFSSLFCGAQLKDVKL